MHWNLCTTYSCIKCMLKIHSHRKYNFTNFCFFCFTMGLGMHHRCYDSILGLINVFRDDHCFHIIVQSPRVMFYLILALHAVANLLVRLEIMTGPNIFRLCEKCMWFIKRNNFLHIKNFAHFC